MAEGSTNVTEAGGVKMLASSTHGWQEYSAGVVADASWLSLPAVLEVAEVVVTGILKPCADWSLHV